MYKSVIFAYKIDEMNNVKEVTFNKRVTFLGTYEGLNLYSTKDGNICTDYNLNRDDYLYIIMNDIMYNNFTNREEKKAYFDKIKDFLNEKYFMDIYKKYDDGLIDITDINVYYACIFVNDDIRRKLVLAIEEYNTMVREKREEENQKIENEKMIRKQKYIDYVIRNIMNGDMVTVEELHDVIKMTNHISIRTAGAIRKYLIKYQLNKKAVWFINSDKINANTKQSIVNALYKIKKDIINANKVEEIEEIEDCTEEQINHLFGKGV